MATKANNNALVELDDMMRWMQFETHTEDEFLQSAINDWSDTIEKRLKRTILSTTHTDERHDGGRRSILLHNFPVTAVSSVSIDGGALGSLDYTYETGPGIVRMCSGREFAGKRGSILVTYTAGFSTVPGDLRRVVKQLVALEYYLSARGNKAIIKAGESLGGGNVSYQRGPDEQEKLMKKIERMYARR